MLLHTLWCSDAFSSPRTRKEPGFVAAAGTRTSTLIAVRSERHRSAMTTVLEANSEYQTLKSTNQSDHLINPPRPPKVIAFPFHPLRSPKPLQSPFDNFRSPLISTHTGSHLHSLQVIHWTWPFRTLWTYLTTSCLSWPLKSPQPPQTSYWTSDNTYYMSWSRI